MVAFAAWLFVGGMAAASCNSAGGRLVSGWFPPEQRGLAMGVRQTAQPLGIALGALVIPELAERSRSATSALIFPAVLCAAAAVLSAWPSWTRRARTRATATDARAGQPLPRLVGAAPNPCGLSAVDGAADDDRDVHADLADHELPVFDRGGGCVVTVSQLLGARAVSWSADGRTGSVPGCVRSASSPSRAYWFWPALALADHLRSSIAVPLMVAAAVSRCSTTGWNPPRSPNTPDHSGVGARWACRTPISG